jgi:hypothetical protein
VEGADLAAGLLRKYGIDEPIHAEYPRLDMARSLVDAIVERAGRSAAARAPFTVGGELLRERQTDGITRLERAPAPR